MNERSIIKDFCLIRNNKVVISNIEEVSFPGLQFNEYIIKVYQRYSVNYPKFYKMDNLSKLGFLSAEILIKKSNPAKKYSDEEVGVILSNASSSLDIDKTHQKSIMERKDYFPSPAVFVYTLPNIMIGEICIRHKLFGEGIFFVHEKFNAGFLCSYIENLLSRNKFKSCITGWVDVLEDSYESVLYFIEKGQPKEGIAIFEPSKMIEIYNEQF